MTKIINFLKNKGAKFLIFFCSVLVLLFQTISFCTKPANAELIEAIRIEKEIQSLALKTDSSGNYLISSATDLNNLASGINAGNTKLVTASYVQTNNITLTGDFIPIGSKSGKPFMGTYDGNNFIINGLNVPSDTDSSYIYRGLFGSTNEATIKNVVLKDGNVYCLEGLSAGALIGNATNTTITNCHNYGCNVYANASSKNATLGGLVGYMSGGRIEQCLNAADVTNNQTGTAWAGGVVGIGLSGANISQCQNSGFVTAGTTSTDESYAGGVAGYAQKATILNCAVQNVEIKANAKKTPEKKETSNTKSIGSTANPIKITKTSTVNSTKYKAYSGGIAGKADSNSTITNVLVYNCDIQGGKTINTYRYEYSTNDFVAYGESKNTYLFGFTTSSYTKKYYHNYKYTIKITPTENITHVNVICGDGNPKVTSAYQKSNTWTGVINSGKMQFTVSSMTVKCKTVDSAGATTTNPNTNLSIMGVETYFDENGKPSTTPFSKIMSKMILGYFYYVDGTHTFTSDNMTITKPARFYQMSHYMTLEALDSDGLGEDDEGLKLTKNWKFTSGANTYEYTDTVINKSDFSYWGGETAPLAANKDTVIDKSIWGNNNPSINNSCPYLKYFYWSDNVVMPPSK